MLFPEIKQERVLRKQNLPCFCENVDKKKTCNFLQWFGNTGFQQ